MAFDFDPSSSFGSSNSCPVELAASSALACSSFGASSAGTSLVVVASWAAGAPS